MIRLSKAAERLRQGARVISLRKIPTLTEDGEMPSQSENGVLAPRTEGGEIHNQSEQGVPAPIEGRAIPSQSEPIVPAPIEGGEILSQSERVVPAPVEGGETQPIERWGWRRVAGQQWERGGACATAGASPLARGCV